MSLLWQLFVIIKHRLGKDPTSNSWCEYRGYRKAVGGRWGLWEIKLLGPFKIWIYSSCHHYPMPPLATHTEPIQVEDYTQSSSQLEFDDE